MAVTTSRTWPNVSAVKDRHGKVRYRYQRRGVKGGYMHGAPGSPEWEADFARYEAQGRESAAPAVKPAPRTMDALAARYRASTRWQRMESSSRYTFGRLVDRVLAITDRKGNRFGARPVDAITVASLEKMLGRFGDTPGTANAFRKTLRMMFAYAIKLDWRHDNPAALTDKYKGGPGFHTWTDDEIEQYRARWAYGTKARLALELALNTAARRCNVAQLTRAQLRAGKFHIEHVKGGEVTIVRATAETLAAIEAMQATGIGHFLVTDYGKPFTVAGLGNKMREWCDDAGLRHCSMHGLRKAQSRRLAESGATDAQGRAVTGQKKNETFAHYAAKADRERLADAAITNLENQPQPTSKKGK